MTDVVNNIFKGTTVTSPITDSDVLAVSELLKEKSLTIPAISKELNIQRYKVRKVITILRASNKLHVSDWILGRTNDAVYSWGEGKNFNLRSKRLNLATSKFIPRPDIAAAWITPKAA
jgi:transcription initiation factor IIE alpha subunit